MASRALNPLRRIASSPQLRRTPIPASRSVRRTIGTATGARRYPATATPAKAATASTTTPTPAAAAATTTTASRTPAKSSVSASPKTSASPARAPVPPVTDQPLPDAPPTILRNDNGSDTPIDWSSSFHGLGTSTFGKEVAAILLAPLNPDDIEIKPDGIVYLPEIKYRRVLNLAFGPGGWGLAPRGDLVVKDKLVSRDYALIVHGRFVGQARGEQQFFRDDGISTASEGCKSNALMRCCKDLGIASELWDPRYIRRHLKQYGQQVWVEHSATKKKSQIWLRKDDEVRYPFKKT